MLMLHRSFWKHGCFIIIIEDGSGQSEIVAVALSATEDSETLQQFLEAFKEINMKWSSIKITMADKDLRKNGK